MKILVLTWEFPPRIVGGIARHVAELYPELVALGHEVHLLTVEFGECPGYEIVEGVHVHRVPVGGANDFFHWVVNMNDSMGYFGGKLITEEGPFDLIHAHDWLVGDAAIALKNLFKIPMIATIHATERGRYNGIYTDTQHYINAKEARLCYEAWRVIVCTWYMKGEVERAFNLSWDKIDVIANGIKKAKKQLPENFDFWGFRRRYAEDVEKIVYYVGRMTYEKGVQVLVEAMPRVLWEMGGNVKFVIIGGGNTSHLRHRAEALGIGNKVYFTGFVHDDELDRFQRIADCAVFPSLYEPFGIVALESMEAWVPVVVSDTGGLPEVVTHTKTGVVTWANNAESLSWGILEVIKHPGYAQWLKDNAHAELDLRFRWDKLAGYTSAVFERVVYERKTSSW